MPAPTPTKTRAQVVALAKAGHSVRTIEGMLAKRGVHVGKSTIAELVKLYRAGALPDVAPAPSSPKASSRTPAAPTAAALTPATSSVEGVKELDPTEVADLHLAELVKLARLFHRQIRLATKVGDVKLVSGLLSSRMLVAKEIARLRPVVPADPAKDPANLEARDLLRERLEQLVESARTSDPALELLRAHLKRAEETAQVRRRAELALETPAEPVAK